MEKLPTHRHLDLLVDKYSTDILYMATSILTLEQKQKAEAKSRDEIRGAGEWTNRYACACCANEFARMVGLYS